MLPSDLTEEIVNRLKSIGGQVSGLARMLETEDDPDKILIQFKAAQTALDKAHYLLLDEVYRKALAIKIVEAVNACPGNCGNEDKIEFIRQQFPAFTLDELTRKMQEITELKKRLEQFNQGHP
ncbi:MAG: metal-sensitive transcriptional regulator [Chitinophagaceae bacterium]|nr:MAG: metal-sensitive transcriptional regulator [Chitinophagaceae bacterium]